MADLIELREKANPSRVIILPRGNPYDEALWEPVPPQKDTRSGTARFLQDVMTPPVAAALKAPAALLPEGSGPMGRQAMQSFGEGAAKFIVPQDEASLGMMLGTLGGGAIAQAGRLGLGASRAARIAGAGLGAASGENFLNPEATLGSVGRAGLTGVAGGTVGEAIGAGAGMLRRGIPNMGSLPVGRAGVNRADVKAVGRGLGEAVPPFKGHVVTLDDAMNLARTEKGKKLLSTAFREHAQRLDTITNNAPLNIRAIDSQNPVTISRVLDELKTLGARAFRGAAADPRGRTVTGLDDRRLYADIMRQTRGELLRVSGPDAVVEFETGRRVNAIGNIMLDTLKGEQVYRGGANVREVNMNALRRRFEKNLARLTGDLELLPADTAALIQPMYRGGAIGTRDEPAPGFGRALESVFRMFQGRDTGATQYLFGTLRALYPNPTRYTGTPPFTPGNLTQVPVDISAGLLSHRLMEGTRR